MLCISGGAVSLWAHCAPSDAAGVTSRPMPRSSTIALRLAALLSAAIACFAADVTAAHAQSQSCQRLEETLATLDRNGDFREVGENSREARSLGQDVQRAESAY